MQKFSLTISLSELALQAGYYHVTKRLETWRLIPPSRAKTFPTYVPKAVTENYTEACRIVDLSPKSAATLARRSIQGMIRDFWGIKKSKLAVAINAIKGKVESLTWKAIDAVRSVGNIGAHMEKDINLIIDVDPGEAEKLIGFVEYLIQEWYVRRHEQEQRLKEVVAIADAKAAQRKTGTQTSIPAAQVLST